MPLGLLPDREYDEVVFQARAGDLWCCSRTVCPTISMPRAKSTDAADCAQVVQRCCDFTPKQIVDEIFADLDQFNTERFDDQTSDRDASETPGEQRPVALSMFRYSDGKLYCEAGRSRRHRAGGGHALLRVFRAIDSGCLARL